MAKFKVGDKVTDGNSVFQITKVNPDDYGWKLVKGDGKDAFGKSISAGGMISWADQKMRKAANAVTSKNPVVANAISAKNAVAKNAAISDEKELLRLVGTEMNQARAHLGNVIRNAKQGKAGGIKNFYTDHVSDLERIYNELWKF